MSEAANRGLYFIRNREDLDSQASEHLGVEYEVVSDADIVGDLTYGPYNFTIWELGTTPHPIEPVGYERKLCLRVKYARTSSEVSQHEGLATRRGFYHRGGIPEELVILCSLFLRRRFKLGPIVRYDDKPMMYSQRGLGWVDAPLILGQSNLQDLAQKLPLAEHLSPDLHQKFILAARLYHQALVFIEEEPDLAYLNLVSAIEVLCQNTDVGQVTLRELGYERLADLLSRVGDESLREELEQAILARERLIKRRFVQFILNHTEATFWLDDERWPEDDRPEYGRIDSSQLERLLKKIYDQRSATLHKGEPFPPQISDTHRRREDIDTSISLRFGDREWRHTDYLPNHMFFERLVNHVLVTYLRRNQIENPTTN